MSWAAGEMKTINLGDKRLNKRLLSLFDKLGNSPNLSIPAACGRWHETKAAYRFFDHEQVTTNSRRDNLWVMMCVIGRDPEFFIFKGFNLEYTTY